MSTAARRPPRAAVCLINTAVSGAEMQFIRTVRGFADRGDDVVLIMNRRLHDAALGYPECVETLALLRERGLLALLPRAPSAVGERGGRLWLAFHVALAARRHRVEVLHTVLFGFGASLAAMAAGTRVVAEISSPDYVGALLPRSRGKRAMVERVACFHACSPSVHRRFQRIFGEAGLDGPAGRAVAAPLPYAVVAGEPGSLPKEDLVVFASRFIDRKNPVLFARAARRFLESRPGWRAAMLGFGPLEDELREILAPLAQAGRAEVGYTTDLLAYLRRSRVYASLIHPDNYPSQSVFEAMHMKNALVLTDAGDSRVLAAPENGILVGFDEDQVVTAFQRLADDPGRTAAMGEASRERVLREFAPERYLDHLLAVYDRAARGSPAPPPAA